MSDLHIHEGYVFLETNESSISCLQMRATMRGYLRHGHQFIVEGLNASVVGSSRLGSPVETRRQRAELSGEISSEREPPLLSMLLSAELGIQISSS